MQPENVLDCWKKQPYTIYGIFRMYLQQMWVQLSLLPGKLLQKKSSQFNAGTLSTIGRMGRFPKIDPSGTLPNTFPVLRGGIDIHPYSPPVASCLIARNAIRKPLERYLSPKLFVVKSTDRLQAVLDQHGHAALQTLYLLHLRNHHGVPDQLYFFLALLNSR